LEHLGEMGAAKHVMSSIESVTADPTFHTRDLGGTATTEQVTKAVCDAAQARIGGLPHALKKQP
jgi:tartrate dehydrogenase/decarboxylase / D-malate dehydrogenase